MINTSLFIAQSKTFGILSDNFHAIRDHPFKTSAFFRRAGQELAKFAERVL